MTTHTPDHDWLEDFEHYFCTCCMCGATFLGNKRRVVCKLCANKTTDQTTPDTGDVEHEWLLLCCDGCGAIHLDDPASDSESCECSRFKQRMEFAKSSEVMAYINKLRNSHAALVAACEAKDAEIAKLLELLAEARDMVQCWGEQNDEYFQEKWDLKGDLVKLDAALTAHQGQTNSAPDSSR